MMSLTDIEDAVFAALCKHACPRGRVQIDKHAIAKEVGEPHWRCCDARTRLLKKKRIRKIGFSRPMLVQVPV